MTKFAELRPKWCIIASTSGTHSVCVCVLHQNPKIMIDTANLKFLTRNSYVILNDYKDCIKFLLCEEPNEACHLLQCKNCPKMEEFSNFLLDLFEQSNVLQIIFSTWQSTDRCTLKQECLLTEDFIDELSKKLLTLIPHSFIAKIQSEFISDKKENLKEDEVLLQCDFAENYAYVIQDAAQAFHYNNDQCSVFTVVFYYRLKNEIQSCTIILLSNCTTHDAAAVYIMQEKVIPVVKEKCPKVRKIFYVTDGAKQHFKNR